MEQEKNDIDIDGNITGVGAVRGGIVNQTIYLSENKILKSTIISGIVISVLLIAYLYTSVYQKEVIIKEKLIIESNATHQTTYGNNSPIINTEKDVNINYWNKENLWKRV